MGPVKKYIENLLCELVQLEGLSDKIDDQELVDFPCRRINLDVEDNDGDDEDDTDDDGDGEDDDLTSASSSRSCSLSSFDAK